MHVFTALLFFLIAAILPLTGLAHAAETAFLRLALTAPVWSGDALILSLSPDEAACRKAYGKNWEQACAAAPGQSGAPVRGVRLTPDLPGQWHWQGSSTLQFRPTGPWPAAVSYTVDMQGLALPARLRLTPRTLAFSTLPLAAHAPAPGQVWTDPQAGLGGKGGEHAVSFDLAFTTPPVRETVQRQLTLGPAAPVETPKTKAEGKDANLKVGAPIFVWSQDGTACLVKARLLELPDKDTVLELRLPGVVPLVQDGGWKTLPRKELRLSVVVPGASGLFRITQATLTQAINPVLDGEYHLTLKTSLLTTPAQALRALKVVELPEKQNPEALRPYAWNKAPRVTLEDLEKGRPLTLEPLTQRDAPTGSLSFRVPVRQGRHVFVYLPAGFEPAQGGGSGLARPWQGVFHAAPAGPRLAFLQPGAVLALSGERRLDMVSSGLTSLRWRAARVLQPHLGWLGREYGLFASGEPSFLPIDTISEAVEGVVTMTPADTEKAEGRYHSLDLGPVLSGGRGLVRLEVTGRAPNRQGVEEDVITESRLVMVTDLGLLVKKGADGTRAAFVCSLSTGLPVAGVRVRVLGLNGQPVAEARTDAQGRANLPALQGLTREKTPMSLTGTLEKDGMITDLVWLSLEDSQRAVDYSRFAVQGQVSADEGINAYVFAQRGIFRPGETLRFGTLVRRGDWQPLPPDMPLEAVLRDPGERTVMRRPFTPGPDGLADFSWDASETAPSGRYRLHIMVRDTVLGSGAVRVEEFQPDTLAVRAEVYPPPAKGWLPMPEPAALSAAGDPHMRVMLRNLYGLPAVDRRVRGQLSVQGAVLRFAGFEDYVFHDPQPWKGEALNRDLPETRTDAQGGAVLPLELARLRGGTLQCRVLVEGFEPGGGRAVSMEQTFLVSPLRSVLGYKPSGPGTHLEFLPQGLRTQLEFVALGPDLRPVNPGPLTFSVAERRYVSTLVTDREGRYGYDETPLERERTSTVITPPEPGNQTPPLRWDIPTDIPGEFLLTVRDAGGQVMARAPFTVAGHDDLRPATAARLPSSVLRLHLDKADYAPGDTVRLLVSAPYKGTGLITLERDRVAHHVWFAATAGNSVQNLVIPKDFEGRGYITVSVARGLDSPDIFMQPYSLAVAPVTVNVARRDMGLAVRAPELTLPGGTMEAVVTARTPGRAIIFAVDEGVLSLTRFVTPDPLHYLLLDRALEVDTRQMFDLLMPDHAQLRRRIPAFGGDMSLGGGRFANPFKRRSEPPLAWWSAPVDIGPGGVTVRIPAPPWYSGTVRIMAVGASADTAGQAQGQVVVRGPVTLTPQLPVMAAPGDSFEAPLAIANNGDAPVTLRLHVETDAGLRLDSAPPAEVTVPPGHESLVPLRLTALDMPGSVALRVTVRDAQGRETRREASLSLRPASAPLQKTAAGHTAASVTLRPARELWPWEAQTSASVSPLPLPAVRSLYRSLKTYPYGCVEQRLSRALPLALQMRVPDLPLETGANTPETARQARATLDAALQGVQAALSWNGVRPWPDGEGAPDTLLTAYAGDYLLALREAGVAVPGDIEERLGAALENRLGIMPETMDDARALSYALWVLTRSGRITTPHLERITAALEERLPGWRADITATLLAGSYAVMRMEKQAERLMEGVRVPGGANTSWGTGPLDLSAAQALHVAVLARHFPQRLRAEASALAARMMELAGGPHVSTFAAAQSIRALLALAQAGTGETNDNSLAGVQLICTAMQPGFAALAPAEAAVMVTSTLPLFSMEVPGCAEFRLTLPQGARPLYYEVSSRGYDRRPPVSTRAQGMDVARCWLDAEGAPLPETTAPLRVRQGDMITVELTVRMHGGEALEVVLVDILPGGFEMVLENVDVPRRALPAEATATGEAEGEGSAPDPVASPRVDRREDRLLVFARVDEEPLTVRYRIRAVNKGTFTRPPFQGEGMYVRSREAATAAGTVVVE